ncbi:hypothetical protein KKB44_03065 [Candidatus Micrarchaeota archaeon]|nr:hypothetical protein [Candidatus Micrarchaeota archaeon]
MAKKKSSKKKKISKKKIPVKTDAASVEKNTINRVNHTITVIEKFLAKWEASKVKSRSMEPQIEKIRKFHDELVEWQKKAVKGKDNEKARLERLQDFVLMCKEYT